MTLTRLIPALAACLGLAATLATPALFAMTDDAPTNPHPGTHPGFHEFVLDNGLKLIVKEDHRAPVMTAQVWYKVGGADEYRGVTGISHMLEHMMFKGTKNLPGDTFSRTVSENGGVENAFTSQDYTGYYQQMAADRVEVSFRMEAERMRHLLLDDGEFKKERKVVMEERRLRYDDRPTGRMWEQLYATAFNSGPYRDPVIGWMEDIKGYKLSDLQAWYEQYYAPNNATVVVAGDVDPKQVFALAKQYFGPLKPSKLTPRTELIEAPQLGERRFTLRIPAKLDYLMMGWKIPSIRELQGSEDEWEAYALEVLAGVLDGGDSARLPNRLVRGREIAASAGASADTFSRYGDLFLLNGVPADGTPVAELEDALRNEVEILKHELVSDAELKRIKAQTAASKVFERDSVQHQATQIGALETMGLDWRLAETYLEKIEAVSAEQVRAVARKYLIDDQLTIGVIDPVKKKAAFDPTRKPRI